MKEIKYTGIEVAVVGISGKFPGADNVLKYWDNIKNGIESISFFSDEELAQSGIGPEVYKREDYVKAKGVIDDADCFDAGFFHITPKDAMTMNPQTRLFLETAWEAFEDAGYAVDSYRGIAGIYAGASFDTVYKSLYSTSNMAEEFGTELMANKDFISSRVAYSLNLKGPCYSIQTACSTSLVAVHMACRGLITGECDMALAGGISLTYPYKTGYVYQEGMFVSPDGHCRPFDKKASGTVGGNGVGIVVLRRLKDAIRDHDHIYAIIKGSAVSNDGNDKIGYTVPGLHGIQRVVRSAYQIAQVDPETIGYMETHGTGTMLGDTIEIEAITELFQTGKRNYCPIGSVKANIGHLDAASGIASFIKGVFVAKNRMIPPLINFSNPNSNIKFDESPFYISNQLSAVSQSDIPMRVGVNSFGMGGTNVHVILEEAPITDNCINFPQNELIILSARTNTELSVMARNLSTFIKNNPEISLRDVAYTLQLGRNAFRTRAAFICNNSDTLQEGLSCLMNGRFNISSINDKGIETVLVFSNDILSSAHYLSALYSSVKIFRNELDNNLEIVNNYISLNTIELYNGCFPEISTLVLNYSLSQLLIRIGVQPDYLHAQGTSFYAAACLAGVIRFEEAIQLLVSLRNDQASNESTMEGSRLLFSQFKINKAKIKLHSSQNTSGPDINSFMFWHTQFLNERDNEYMPDEIADLKRFQLLYLNACVPFLDILRVLWMNGTTIDWAKVNQDEGGFRISLPTYPFVRKRYALPNVAIPIKQTGKGVAEKTNVDKCLYKSYWEPFPIYKGNEIRGRHTWLIFADGYGIGDKAADYLRENNQMVICIRCGPGFVQVSDVEYRLAPGEASGYEMLFELLQSKNIIPDQIMHMWCVSAGLEGELTVKGFDEAQEYGLFSVSYLVDAFCKYNSNRKMQINVVTNNVQNIFGDEVKRSEYATVLGVGKEIPFEYRGVLFKSIDIDLENNCVDTEEQAKAIIFETLQDNTTEEVVLYKKRRLVKRHRLVESCETFGQSMIKHKGVYLILGGLGNVGLLIAEYLAKTFQVKLVLVGRNPIPKESEWKNLSSPDKEPDSRDKVFSKLLEFKLLGSEVTVLSADISVKNQLEDVFTKAEDTFGHIDGVFHCAGFVGSEAKNDISSIDKVNAALHFAAKAKGLIHVNRIISRRNIRFCLCFSSLSSVLGGSYLSLYTAANLFMDHYAQQQNSKYDSPIISINWDTWVVKNRDDTFHKMDIDEGMAILDRVLRLRNNENLIISTRDLNLLIERRKEYITSQGTHDVLDKTVNEAVDEKDSSNTLNKNDKQIVLMNMWSDFFHRNDLKPENTFFDLGCDSLKVIELITLINHKFKINLKVNEFFSAKSIGNISEVINEKIRQKQNYYPVTLQSGKEYYPVSYAQMELYEADSETYLFRHNLGNLDIIEGSLDIAKFEDALRKTINRHEVLHTSFHRINGQIVQRINREFVFKAAYHRLNENEVQAYIDSFIQALDLSKPHIKVHILEVHPQKYYILTDMHHIIFDEVSLHIFYRDVWSAYYDEPLEPVIYQYKDYAVWQHDLLKCGLLDGSRAYWRSKLSGLKLPIVSSKYTAKYDSGKMEVNNQLYERIEQFCKEQKTTKTTLIIAVLILILGSETENDDMSIGLRLSGRRQKEFNQVFGCFLEKAIIRVQINYDKAFTEYLQDVNKTVLEAVDHSIYPFALVKEDFLKDRSFDGGQLIRIMANYMIVGSETEENSGRLKIQTKGIKKIHSKYDINFQIIDYIDHMTLQCKYNECIYSSDHIASMFYKLGSMLDKAIQEDDLKLKVFVY